MVKSPVLWALALLLAAGSQPRAAGIISGDRLDEPVKKQRRSKRRSRRRKASKPPSGGGDIQVGPAVRELSAPTGTRRSRRGRRGKRAAAAAAATPAKGGKKGGIFPVYEAGGRWMVIERVPAGSSHRSVTRGTELVVIGSRGVDKFYASRSTRTYLAACENNRPAPTLGYLLKASSAKNFKRVGTPVIALPLRKGVRFNPAKAWFYRLANEVREDTYKKLEKTIRGKILEDVASGAYLMDPEDEGGHKFAKDPDPEDILMKIDFGSKIRYRGMSNPFVLVDDVKISRSRRRCVRLFDGDKPVGDCAEMPHELLSETQGLKFVAYDPSRRNRPFVLAFTDKEPLWGHERWGIQLTQKGPKVFLKDALDPKCRAGF